MAKWFNTAGPCQSDIHYMVPPLQRLPEVTTLIHQRGYFVLHAPRQTGKTTLMLALADALTASGQYTAVMLSVEVGSVFPSQPGKAEQAILGSWQGTAQIRLPIELHPPSWPEAEEGIRITTALETWAKLSPRPLVIFVDEIDSLQDEALLSVLRQLRSGYPNRPNAFPQSVALIGLRDVRDYKVASGGSSRLTTASPFNVKVESLTLENFSIEEVKELYQQHTEETGQPFTPKALERAFSLSQGQPWLVNALAKQIVNKLVVNRSEAITVEHVNQAKEILIQRRDTHLDSLTERLKEDRVKAILQPMLAGRELSNVPVEDIEFVLDLGLCRLDESGNLVIANPIYQEILPRMLAFTTSVALGQITPSWLKEDGELDARSLLDAFVVFWRQNGQPLLRNVSYHEIAPHIVMMAFLHRVVNGKGTLEREYAIGKGRMDLCLRYGKTTLGIELKVWREGSSDPLERGLDQLDGYLAGLGLEEGWLVIFDQRQGVPDIAERTTVELVRSGGDRSIHLIRA